MTDNKKYAIGVDFGGTSIKIGVVSRDGKLVRKTAVDTMAEGGPKTVLSQISKGINFVIGDFKDDLAGIGIGSPGVVSIEKGTVENPPNIPNWKKVALGDIITKEFNQKVIIENDANAAAIGELIFGAGKNMSNFIMVTLGTGVGGGIIINGDLYRGETGAAGELGHITIDYDGYKCNCGSLGCIETYAGNGYIVSRVKRSIKKHSDSRLLEFAQGNVDLITPKVISQAANAGDEYANSIIKETAEYIGFSLASAVNLFDISTIIIGGGVAGFGKTLFKTIQDTIKERALKSIAKRVKVLPAKLKNEAGILGASALVFHKLKD